MRAVGLVSLLLVTGCAAPVCDVTVSEPKVYGDEQVLRLLARKRRALRALAPTVQGAEVQEVLGVRQRSHTRTRLGANLLDPQSTVLPHPPQFRKRSGPHHDGYLRRGPYSYGYRSYARPRPAPGLDARALLRKGVSQGQLVSAYDLLFTGDTKLLGRRARVVLLRFEVSFNSYQDLGGRKRFALVRFRIRSKRKPAPKLSLYLLSPSFTSLVSQESLSRTVIRQYALRVLGAYGGIGLGAGRGGSSTLRERFQAATETPLQFAIYGAPRKTQDELSLAFAFGPRRRLTERSLINPLRWFGSRFHVSYEIQPGPRTCEALLVFPDVDPKETVELTVSVEHDGRLLRQDELDLRRALHLRARKSTFVVRCPPARRVTQTRVVRLLPHVKNELLLLSDRQGPAFSGDSVVYLGPARLSGARVRVLGRGRLAVTVPPQPALLALLGCGTKTVAGRVLTPDQPDLQFQVRLLRPKPAQKGAGK